MDKICKNCNHIVENNYCSNCGQSIKVGKLNFTYLIDELQHTVIHADKGIFYTIKELLFNPGNTVKNYLEGKRVKLFKPFGFLIILATINGFLSHILDVYVVDFSGFLGVDTDSSLQMNRNYLVIYDWLYNHYSLLSLVSIVPLSFFSLVLFRKFTYGYVEYLVINAYSLGIQCFLFILLIPISILLSSNTYFEVASVVTFFYFIWFYITLFKSEGVLKVMIKSFILYILYFLALLIIGFLGGFVWFILSLV